ncbi:hypothetical protein V0288_14005 [Pannus brasiliensis CCIBt3594]|uniref:Uncharacterized protein n=1 Tax=Pannus brasiliensis CCIBt3594 TaxID=1427578 RepID=A0AAW9QZ38_9CHRO
MLGKFSWSALFSLILLFSLSIGNALASAAATDSGTPNLPLDRVREAGDTIIRKEDKNRANEIYFKGSKEGARIIDRARENARAKLKILADKAEKKPNASLSDSEKSFLTKFDTADDR